MFLNSTSATMVPMKNKNTPYHAPIMLLSFHLFQLPQKTHLPKMLQLPFLILHTKLALILGKTGKFVLASPISQMN